MPYLIYLKVLLLVEPLVCLQQVLTLCPPWPQKLQPQEWSWKRWKLERFHMEKILHWLVPCLLVRNVAWNQYVLFYTVCCTKCCLESVCIILTFCWYRMLPGISIHLLTGYESNSTFIVPKVPTIFQGNCAIKNSKLYVLFWWISSILY